MKQLIRNSVFETNSSSCHSISVGNSGVYKGYPVEEDGSVIIEHGFYGWEKKMYTSVCDRLSYVWIYIRDWSGAKSKDFLEMFTKVVLDHTGGIEIIEDPRPADSYSNQGYIDHQSVEDSDLDFIFESEAVLKSFLFDSKSYLQTDNDNH